ncbi:MAG: cytochrome c family protein [Pseudomonadota bacterium]
MYRLAQAAGLTAMILSSVSAHAGDPAQGAKVFHKCKACHAVENGSNGIGPHLFGIVGRPVGAVAGFLYSEGMAEFSEGRAWTVAELDAYLTNPRKHVKGTKMAFGGLTKEDQRADVIAYLATLR